jgi:REP element-mobilizing transposase RayT
VLVATPPRHFEAGTVLHVFSRGVERRAVFCDNQDRRRFLHLLSAACHDDRLRCLDYCLMGNHFHLVAQVLDEPFGDVMRDTLAAYAQAFNERQDRKGHLFEQRYRAKPVRSERYLFALVRYVAHNPVVAGFCAGPDKWAWSGCRELLGSTTPSVTAPDHMLKLLGETVDVGRRTYRTLIMDATERHVALARITCEQEPASRRVAMFGALDKGCRPDEIAAAASLHIKSVQRLLRERT